MLRWLAKLLPVFALVALITCGDIDTLTVEESATTTVPGSTLGQLVGSLGFDGFAKMNVSQNQTLQNQGVEAQQIDSVKVQTLMLTITDPPTGQDFTFIDSLAFYVESPGIERKRIATGGPFEAGLTTVGLDVEDVELAPYVAAESMTITSEASGSAPSQDTTIEAVITLAVDVNISGALCGS